MIIYFGLIADPFMIRKRLFVLFYYFYNYYFVFIISFHFIIVFASRDSFMYFISFNYFIFYRVLRSFYYSKWLFLLYFHLNLLRWDITVLCLYIILAWSLKLIVVNGVSVQGQVFPLTFFPPLMKMERRWSSCWWLLVLWRIVPLFEFLKRYRRIDHYICFWFL